MTTWKKILLFSFVMGIVLMVGCSSGGGINDNPITEPETATLTVTVLDAVDDTQQIEGATVTVGNETATTDENGLATFVLETGTYNVLAAKEGYLSSTEKTVDLSNDNSKTFYLAAEQVSQAVDENTDQVSNGFFAMDVSDPTVNTKLSGEQVTVTRSTRDVNTLITNNNLDETQDITTVGSPVSFKIGSGGITSTQAIGSAQVTKPVTTKITLNLDKFVDDQSSFTNRGLVVVLVDSNGDIVDVRIVSGEVANGEITGIVPITDVDGNLLSEITIALAGIEDYLTDAKTFVNNLVNHGVNLKEAGQAQADKIQANLKNQVVPYVSSMGARLYEVGQMVDIYLTLMEKPAPGDYLIDMTKYPDGNYVNDFVEAAEGDYTWNISFLDTDMTDQLTFTMTNPNEVYKRQLVDDPDYDVHVIETVDLSNLMFSFEHTRTDATDFIRTLNFTLESTSTREVTEQDTDTWTDYEGTVHNELYEVNVTVPVVATATVEGTMTDTETYLDPYTDSELPQIGTVTLNGTTDFFSTDANTLKYSGEFDSEEVDFTGETTMVFSQDLASSFDNEQIPLPVSYSSDSTFTTKVFKLTGGSSVDFIAKTITLPDTSETSIPLPDLVNFHGGYQDIEEGTETGFAFNGDLEFDPDYTNYVIDLTQNNLDTPDNYLPLEVTLNGALRNTGFADVDLELIVARDGYEHVSSHFSYYFDTDKYIEGEAGFGANEDFNLTAENEMGLQIEMGIFDSQGGLEKIGEIRSDDGVKLIGEIVMQDGQPVVQFIGDDVLPFAPSQSI